MNAKNCCYTIFSRTGNKISKYKKKIELNLQLNGEAIPYSQNPVFLGITLDEYMCFNKHIESLRERALSRLNIIIIISHSSWHLNLGTLRNIYDALVGSIFSYSSFALANVSYTYLEKSQTIQNKEIRIMY